MKKLILSLVMIATAFPAFSESFNEVWGYLYKGEEKLFPVNAPFTDIACFSAEVDKDGHLSGGHERPPKLEGAWGGARYHLVVTIPWNSTLAHIYLDKSLPFRNRIIADIVKRSAAFDGVQVDFESISSEDGTAYLNFLASVKASLPKGKIFSVAVPARWDEWVKKRGADAFDYPFVNRFADRVIVMAYDEHYRAGPAGPIASQAWCEKVFAYAQKTIEPGKLIMGLPLYGRSWQEQKLARSYKGSQIAEELAAKQITPAGDPQNGGTYRFQQTVDVEVHYETIPSVMTKLGLYASQPLRGIAFWRIGQEPPGLWKALSGE